MKPHLPPTASLSFSLATALAALFACQSAQAAAHYWDNNGTTTGFGNAGGATWGTSALWTQTANGGAPHSGVILLTTSDAANFGTDTAGNGLGAGTINVSGTVDAASIKFGNQTTGALTLSSGTINLANTTSINVGAGSTTHTITSQITGAATSLTKNGPGGLQLAFNNSYTGQTIISGGTLILNNSAVLGGSNLGVNGTSSISMGANTTLQSNYAPVDLGAADSFVYAPITLTAAGTNNFLIGAGNSTAPAESVTFNINGEIGGTAGANVVFGNTTATRNNADSIIVLGAASTYDGTTTLQAGNTANRINVKAGVADALPTTTVLSFDGVAGAGTGRTTQYDLNGNNQTLAGLTNGGTVANLRNLRVTNSGALAALTINNTADFTYGGSTLSGGTTTNAQITGAISLVKSGAGTFTLGGTLTGGATASGNAFTGSTKILEGILVLGQSNSIQNSAFDTDGSIAGDALNGLRSSVTFLRIGGLTGSNDFATRFTSTTGGYGGLTGVVLNPVLGATHTYSGDIGDGAGAMNLSKANEGTQVLSGTNSYTGITTILRGTLRINNIDDYSAPSSIGAAASGDLVIGSANTGVLDYVGSGDSSNRTIAVGSSLPAEAGGAHILANGGAALNFTATTFNTARTGVTAARTLTLGGAGIGAIQGIIQDNNSVGGGTVAVTKQDGGTWTLSGPNTYTGATNVNGGNLVVNGNIASSSLLTVANGGALSGTGTVGSTVLEAGSEIRPGSGLGTLTTGNLSVTGASTFVMDLAGTTPTTQYDQLSVGGVVDLGSTAILSLNVTFAPMQGDKFFLITNDSNDAINGLFAGIADGAQFSAGGYLFEAHYGADSTSGNLFGGNDFALIAVPETSSVFLVMLSAGTLIFRRRR